MAPSSTEETLGRGRLSLLQAPPEIRLLRSAHSPGWPAMASCARAGNPLLTGAHRVLLRRSTKRAQRFSLDLNQTRHREAEGGGQGCQRLAPTLGTQRGGSTHLNAFSLRQSGHRGAQCALEKSHQGQSAVKQKEGTGNKTGDTRPSDLKTAAPDSEQQLCTARCSPHLFPFWRESL